MRLQYITIMVRDIEKSLDFYEGLTELKIARRLNTGNCEIAFLENREGEAMIELVQLEGVSAEVRGLTLSFSAGDGLDSVWEKACAMGYIPGEIYGEGPKPRYFQLSDPDGVTVEFTV